jgi:hypothetical protein
VTPLSLDGLLSVVCAGTLMFELLGFEIGPCEVKRKLYGATVSKVHENLRQTRCEWYRLQLSEWLTAKLGKKDHSKSY